MDFLLQVKMELLGSNLRPPLDSRGLESHNYLFFHPNPTPEAKSKAI